MGSGLVLVRAHCANRKREDNGIETYICFTTWAKKKIDETSNRCHYADSCCSRGYRKRKCVYSDEDASRSNSHLPIDSFFKYFLSMLGLIKYSGVHGSWMGMRKTKENFEKYIYIYISHIYMYICDSMSNTPLIVLCISSYFVVRLVRKNP